MWALGIILY